MLPTIPRVLQLTEEVETPQTTMRFKPRRLLALFAVVGLCFFVLAQIIQQQRTFISVIKTSLWQRVLVRHSSVIYAGRRYDYRYSAKLFAETNENTSVELGPATAKETQSLPNIVFGVCSFAPEIARRDLIRKTWGSMDDAQLFFIIANPPHDEDVDNVTAALLKEFDEYGDLIWLDVPESYYHSLTPKSFAFQHFANHHYLSRMEDGSRAVLDPSGKYAKTVDYIFKTDTDVFVNTTEMAVELEAKGRPFYYGRNHTGTEPIRKTNKKRLKKYITSMDVYPRDVYPPYGTGWGYAISTKSSFFHYQVPVKTDTIGKSHEVLSNVSATNYQLPQMVSADKLREISNSPETSTLSCTEQVMASMWPMPWEDVATGLLAEACHVQLSAADDEWNGEMKQELNNGGVLVKLLHGMQTHWFETLMVRGSLMEADIQHQKVAKEAQRQRKDEKKEKKRLKSEQKKARKAKEEGKIHRR